MEEEAEALAFFTETLGDFVFSVEELMCELEHAPSTINGFLQRTCGNTKQLSQYLLQHLNRFFLENEKVAIYDPDLVTVREKTVHYFEEKLNLYGKPCNYMDLRSCISLAEVDVQNFIRCFYPADSFKLFLLANPRVFTLFEDDSVFLIENEVVDYFEQCLEENCDGVHYTKMLDYVRQAPKHVRKFIDEYYPEENFLQLLENNSDVFRIEEGFVHLSEDEL